MKFFILIVFTSVLISCDEIKLSKTSGNTESYNYDQIQLPSLVNLDSHLNASSLSLSSGANVPNWTGESGSASAQQGSLSMRPTVVTLTSGPSVNFDGLNDNMTINDSDLVIGTGYTLFVLLKASSNGSDQYLLSKGLDSEDRFRIYINAAGQLRVFIGTSGSNNFSQSSVTFGNLELHVVKMVSLGGGSFKFEVRKNGTLHGTTTAGNYTFPANGSDLIIGAKESTAGVFDSPFNGQISEFIMYDEDFSNLDILDVECQLSQKYSIGLSHACP